MKKRVFLKVLAGAALAPACGQRPASDDEASGGDGAHVGGGGAGPVMEVAVGQVADFPLGTLTGVAAHRVIVGHDQGGLYAMTSLCSHQKCDMLQEGEIGPDGVKCSCHGSSFDTNGQVLFGPANSELVHYELLIDTNATVWVSLNQPVDSSLRVPVP